MCSLILETKPGRSRKEVSCHEVFFAYDGRWYERLFTGAIHSISPLQARSLISDRIALIPAGQRESLIA